MHLLKRSMRNGARHPLRLVLVVVLLGVSLLLVEAMLGLDESAQARLDELSSQIGSSIQITRFGGFLSQQQIDRIVHTPGVVTYTEEAEASCASTDPRFQLIPFPPGTQGTICYGFTPGASAALRVKSSAANSGITMVEGRLFTASEDLSRANVAVIGASLAQVNQLHPGASIGLNSTTFTVIGVYSTGSTLDAFILVPIHTLLHDFPATGVSSLTVYASSATNVAALLNTLHQELGNGSQPDPRRPTPPSGSRRGGQAGDFQFTTTQDQFAPSLQSLEAIQQTSVLSLAVALTAAVLVMILTAFWLVRERRREIGMLRAIGASKGQVVGQFALEMLGFSVLAALLAAVLVLPVGSTIASAAVITPPSTQGVAVGNSATLLAAAQPLTISLTAQSVLVLGLAALFLTSASSAVPAWYVARLRPAHALRVA